MDAFSGFVNTDETIDPLDCTPSTTARLPAKGGRKPGSGASGQPKADRQPVKSSGAAKPAMTTKQRRIHNRELALAYARAGVYVLLAKDKDPLTLDHGRRDTDIPKEEREKVRADFVEKHGFEPLMIGSTKSITTLKRAFAEVPDAVPAINGGPNNLLILDADEKDGGPRLLAEWFRNDPPPPHPITKTQGGGEHHYFRNPLGYGCKAGIFKRDLGTDVKGEGGYVIAQGAIRKDGKSYTPKDATNLVEWFMTGNDNGDPIPELPHAVCVELEKAADVGGTTVATGDERDMVERLHDEVDEYAFDPELGLFDIPHLLAKDPAFARAWTGEEANGSVAHFHIVRGLRREYGDKFEPAHALLAIEASEAGLVYSGNKSHGPGEYNDRDIARDYIKAMKDNVEKSHIVDGSAFGDVSSLVDEEVDDTATTTAKRTKRKLTFQLFDDAADEAFAEPEQQLVSDLIDLAAMIVLYGESNAGKSFFALLLAYCIAAGIPFDGREVQQGLVVYIVAEGGRRFRRRLAALKKRNPEIRDVPLAIVQGAVDLHSGNDVKPICNLVAEAEAATGRKAVLVIIDTLARAMGAGSENDAADMNLLVRHGDKVREVTGAALLYVHHSGKDKAKGARGHSSLRAATDTEMEVTATNGSHVADVTKQRDMDGDCSIRFRLVDVALGSDANGKPRKSAVAEITGSGSGSTHPVTPDGMTGATGPKLSPVEAEVLRFVQSAAETKASKEGRDTTSVEVALTDVLAAVNEDRRACGVDTKGEMKPNRLRNIRTVLIGKGLLVEAGRGTMKLRPIGDATGGFGAVDDDEGADDP